MNARSIFLVLTLVVTVPCRAVTIAQWTFETSLTSSTSGSGTDFGALSPEIGIGSASGHHASASTGWSSPAGNGSARSFSSDHWVIGDYYQFQVSTIGFGTISISWDQTSSATGPNSFRLQYSLDGSSFTAWSDYTVSTITSPVTWNSFSPSTLPSALNNASALYLRLTAISSPGGTAGADRIDNFTVAGTPVQQSVPETLPI